MTVSDIDTLKTRFPAWCIWFGEHTGSYWGVPRRRFSIRLVIEAHDPGEFTRKAAATQRAFPHDFPEMWAPIGDPRQARIGDPREARIGDPRQAR